MKRLIAVLMMCLVFVGCGKGAASTLKSIGNEGVKIIEQFQSGKLDSSSAHSKLNSLMAQIDKITLENDDDNILKISINACLGSASMEILQSDITSGDIGADGLNNIRLDSTLQSLKDALD